MAYYTDRLIIRQWTEDDIPKYADLVSDPEVMKYIGDGTPRDYEKAKSEVEKFTRRINKWGWSRFAVQEVCTGEFIGYCGFSIEREDDIDFGWRYNKHAWGKGYGTEAAAELLSIGMDVFNFQEIVSVSFEDNVGSVKIMKNIGMEQEGYVTVGDDELLRYVKRK
jgi:RimJ/RimL family protein N-acetyltransferase